MFVDEISVQVRAGTGGNGASSFRREKYVPRGGPDGGDGGSGGSVILKATAGLTTLLDYRYRHLFKAESGHHGQGSNKHGKSSPDLVLDVPVGTLVKDALSGQVIGDLVEDGQTLRVALGGRGGRGNARFSSATNQAPRYAENGEPGEERQLQLELKLLADVGLVGLPNAGKSSLLGRISAAHPKIADYPFTTLTPILGVVSLGDHRSCVIADIPGLIEGAHEGLGLGHQFLRHVERTRMLIHVLDITGGDYSDAVDNFDVVTRELESHSAALAALPVIVGLNKIDIAEPGQVEELSEKLQARGLECFPISAVTGQGVERLLYRVAEMLEAARLATPPVSEERTLVEPAAAKRRSRQWQIERQDDGSWRVNAEGLERLVAMTNVDNEAALERLHRTLDRAGVLAALKTAGIQDGETVHIRATEFVFVEEEAMYNTPRRRRRAERAARVPEE